VVLFVALHYLVVLDEEIVLQRGFKEKYERYKDRTRRWM
jgi:protein-S-isoprenylcysteine O-methyltransferase Ste14